MLPSAQWSVMFGQQPLARLIGWGRFLALDQLVSRAERFCCHLLWFLNNCLGDRCSIAVLIVTAVVVKTYGSYGYLSMIDWPLLPVCWTDRHRLKGLLDVLSTVSTLIVRPLIQTLNCNVTENRVGFAFASRKLLILNNQRVTENLFENSLSPEIM